MLGRLTITLGATAAVTMTVLATTVLAMTALAMAAPALASDTPGTVQSREMPSKAANPLPPVGVAASTLPRAKPGPFELLDMLAPDRPPPGTAGVSTPRRDGDAAPGPAKADDLARPPATVARVAVSALGPSSATLNTPSSSYPYRATGKLYARFGDTLTSCSAALVGKGVLVTAAHCVFDYGGGEDGWHRGFVWCPAQSAPTGLPYGCYTAGAARIPAVYHDGSDTCAEAGIVCNNDVATLLVAPKNGVLAGALLGFYRYGWNGYAYRNSAFLSNLTTAQVTQLGYADALDGGVMMQRVDAMGRYFITRKLQNTLIGSPRSSGASGGPWVVNFGTPPRSDLPTGPSATQAIIGVASYGSVAPSGYEFVGASYFGQNTEFPAADYGGYGAGNIGALMSATCKSHPDYC